MKQAQDDARKGDIAGAKRKALQASRFPVQWAADELSPNQLIARLDSGNTAGRPTGINPGAVSGRPTSRASEVVTAAGTNSREQIEQTGFEDEAPARSSGSGSRAGSTSRTPLTGRNPVVAPATGTGTPSMSLRPRVNDYMQQAEAARRQGDIAEATRLAKVAELLAVNVKFEPGDHLVFGAEPTGLPPEVLEGGQGTRVSIPMLEDRRSLNLSTAVGIAAFEALRQVRG